MDKLLKFWVMHENHTFTNLGNDFTSLEDVANSANEIMTESPMSMLCPIIIIDQDGKEVRRVGVPVPDNKWSERLPVWLAAAKADPDILSIMAKKREF